MPQLGPTLHLTRSGTCKSAAPSILCRMRLAASCTLSAGTCRPHSPGHQLQALGSRVSGLGVGVLAPGKGLNLR